MFFLYAACGLLVGLFIAFCLSNKKKLNLADTDRSNVTASDRASERTEEHPTPVFDCCADADCFKCSGCGWAARDELADGNGSAKHFLYCPSCGKPIIRE